MGDHPKRVRALRERLASEDTGTSLVELLVGMVVMGIFMTIATGAVVSMTRTVAEVEAVTTSATQVDHVFLTLDKIIRYADWISPIDESSAGAWYVGLETGRDDVDPSKHTCTQLKVDTSDTLQLRSWRFDQEPDREPAWRTLASNLRRTGAADPDPFTSPPVGKGALASTRYQQLVVTLSAGASGRGSSSTSHGAMTFTALNSSVSTASTAVRCRMPSAWAS